MYVNIRYRLFFSEQDLYDQENLEHYVTPMVDAFQFVTKRYIRLVVISANLALRNY